MAAVFVFGAVVTVVLHVASADVVAVTAVVVHSAGAVVDAAVVVVLCAVAAAAAGLAVAVAVLAVELFAIGEPVDHEAVAVVVVDSVPQVLLIAFARGHCFDVD